MTKMHREGHQLCTVLTTLIPQPIINHPQQFTDIPTQNRLSRNLAKEFKEIGFQFMGPVTTYSFLEAVGLINDHIEDCPLENQRNVFRWFNLKNTLMAIICIDIIMIIVNYFNKNMQLAPGFLTVWLSLM